ncbi:MAG: hypothetical protein SCARUB_02760 [Candidatus Scalindua rubra]|uniref:Uncharacterized protein n=1 Tax=Candidatus Scalindua rubra TaxID=1872076 RepID=A0A1E3X908_9BACT|nr:MAG: hypothetical protein SCARUB_02760 [Candidatus Scalindua rubra]
MNKVITDTGPPLHLDQIGHIRLLEIFVTLVVSCQVKKELQKYRGINERI